MKQWLVDTNVILDVIGADKQFGEASKQSLSECCKSGVLVINPVIFAEVSAYLDSLEETNDLLPDSLFRRDSLPWEAAFLAGKAFVKYKSEGGQKKRILADFLIGAHAAVMGFDIISRDSGIGKYFKVHVFKPALPRPYMPQSDKNKHHLLRKKSEAGIGTCISKRFAASGGADIPDIPRSSPRNLPDLTPDKTP